MGLFSAKYVTTVGTSINRVIDDKVLPHATKTGLVKALFNDGDIPDYILDELNNSLAVKVERAYEYAKNDYLWGTPGAWGKSVNFGREEVGAVIQSFAGEDALLEYIRFGPPNTKHIGWMKLVSEYGYNSETNEIEVLSAREGFQVYLTDMRIMFPPKMLDQDGSPVMEQWGVSAKAGYTPLRKASSPLTAAIIKNSLPVYDPKAENDYLTVEYCWVAAATIQHKEEIKTGELTINVDEYNEFENSDFFHACYKIGDRRYYWIYRVGTGTYPVLDALTKPAVEDNTFLPRLYFRFNKMSTNLDKGSDDYRTSKKLAKYLSIDYDQLADGINANPDIGDVEQAMLMFVVPANTTEKIEQKYLFDYFDSLYYKVGDQESSVLQGQIADNLPTPLSGEWYFPTTTQVIFDHRFFQTIANSGMYRKRVAGSIGPVGTYGSDYKLEEGILLYDEVQNSGATERLTPISVHSYRRQVSAGFYDEIKIVALKSLMVIANNAASTGNDEEDFLLIPIDREISRKYNAAERELLYARGMHLIFNTKVVTKLNWYQQDWFSDLVMAVGIFIAVFTLGTGYAALAAGVAAGDITLVMAINTALMSLVQYLVVSTLVKVFVKAVGMELAFVVAVVAAVAGISSSMYEGSIDGAPFAKELLSISSSLVKGVNSELKGLMADLLGEANDFKALMVEQTKLLDDANELLNSRSQWLNPLTIFGEKPDDFYNRTVHSGNIGAISLSAISNYVDIALTLPKIDETVGETFNAIV